LNGSAFSLWGDYAPNGAHCETRSKNHLDGLRGLGVINGQLTLLVSLALPASTICHVPGLLSSLFLFFVQVRLT
jgi:hypothetical protein